MRFLILSFFLFLTACSSPDEPAMTTITGWSMTMPYQIHVGKALSKEEELAVCEVVEATFAEVDRLVNTWNPDSEMGRVNASKYPGGFLLSADLTALLVEVDRLVSLTDRRFDPTVSPLCHLWKKWLFRGSLPSANALAEAQLQCGWHHVEIHDGWMEKSVCELDLCGVAKGWAIDRMVQRLHALGLGGIYFEWGGEIRTAGDHPSGRPWRVALPGDFPPIALSGRALATSGNGCQYWDVGEERYTHIIDPSNGQALACTLERMATVTICADSCAVADAIATAAMLSPDIDAARIWLETLRETESFDYWISDNTGCAVFSI